MFWMIQLSVILFLSLSMASQSISDLQILKHQIASENVTLKGLQQQTAEMDQEIKELADKRRFYQIFKTQDEKNLIASKNEKLKTTADLKEKIKQLDLNLRRGVSAHIYQNDSGYAEVKKIVVKITPVANLGVSVVNQLGAALQQLNSSQVMSAANATGNAIGMMLDSKRDAFDHIAAGITQMAVDNALKAGHHGLVSAASFEAQLQGLAKEMNLGILSGSWNGAFGRGLIYALISGKNPLNSHVFVFSNNLFQLKNLSEVKRKVKLAQEAVYPVSMQINNELSALQSKLTQAEDELIRQL